MNNYQKIFTNKYLLAPLILWFCIQSFKVLQELITTSSGNEYKFTTKKWLTPKGNWIHKKGVEPDVKIDLSEEYKNNPSEENDNQYNKAIEEAIKER